MKRLVLTIGTLIALSANAEDPYLADNLTVWLRADLGVTAAGGACSSCSRRLARAPSASTWALQRGYYTVEVTASGLCISIR